MVPESEWRWFGLAGHFVCGRWCRFHLCTAVGEYMVSTVGLFVHPMHSAGREGTEAKWLRQNPDGEKIGCNRPVDGRSRTRTRCRAGCGPHAGPLDRIGLPACGADPAVAGDQD